MRNKIKTSLLIATYNWPEALDLVLLSVTKQTHLPNEILIADDGSTHEVKQLIESYKNQFSIPLRHFWHEDDGFRKSIILNQAIAASSFEYIIQIDGDCIIHENFIKDHLTLAEKGVYLYGSRVNIQKDFLPDLFKKRPTSFNLFSKGIKKRTRTLYIPLFSHFFKKTNKLPDKFRGCNTSFWKEDLIAVNGYNEDFKGWGREDSELIVRLINNGLFGRRIRYCGIVYHIYHPEKSRDRLVLNDNIQQNSIEKKLVWCDNGINKYLH